MEGVGLMAKWGKCDYKQLKEFQKKLEKLQQKDFDKFCQATARELAARLLALVIKRTPVGDYSGSEYTCVSGQYHKGRYVKGKTGGTLRRGWTVGKICKIGNTYQVEIINPVYYASYVEYGHRTADHSGWVQGHFMLTIAEQQLQAFMRGKLDKKLYDFLRVNLSAE